MSETEMRSRKEIWFENYAKIINIEAQTMIEMAGRELIPAATAYAAEVAGAAAAKEAVVEGVDVTFETETVKALSAKTSEAYACLVALREADAAAAKETDNEARARAFRDRVIPAMAALRSAVDGMEVLTAAAYWPLPNYGDLMFRI